MANRIEFPVLNVLLGTTQQKVGEYLIQEADHLSPRERQMLSYLFIDTLNFRAGARNDGALIREDDILAIQAPRELRLALASMDPEKKKWLTIANHTPVTNAAGAGGVRNNGHGAFWSSAQRIKERLEGKIKSITTPKANGEQGVPAHFLINVAVYAGGGSASGTLVDLLLLLNEIRRNETVPSYVFVYVTLPTQFRASSPADPDVAKENTMALLLELLAVSVQASEPQGHEQWIGNRFKVSLTDSVADRIFLYENTGVEREEDLCRLIAMDIWMRSLTGEGVGKWEFDNIPNVNSVIERDGRGLPTIFSTSCPLEIVLPAPELARGYAYRLAQVLLEYLSSGGVESVERSAVGHNRVSSDQVKELIDRAKALVRPGTAGQPIYESEFRPKDAFETEEELVDGWKLLERRLEDEKLTSELKDAASNFLQEQAQIDDGILDGMNTLSSLKKRLLERLQLYRGAADEIEKELKQSKVYDRSAASESQIQYLDRNYHGAGSSPKLKGFVARLNEVLGKELGRRNLLEIQRVLMTLRDLTQTRCDFADRVIPDLASYYRKNGKLEEWEEQVPELKLGLSHSFSFRRFAFYLESSAQSDLDGHSPIETVYNWLKQDYVDANERLKDTAVVDFISWLKKRNEVRIMAEGPAERIAQVAIEYWEERLLQRLGTKDVLDYLYGYMQGVKGHTAVDYLQAHLNWIASNARSLVHCTPEVDIDGKEPVHLVTVSAPIKANRSEARDMIENAVYTAARIKPTKVEQLNCDPHCIEVIYSEHGLSLSTIPSFYKSAGGTFLAALDEKLKRTEDTTMQARSPFTSDGMEGLVRELGILEKIRR